MKRKLLELENAFFKYEFISDSYWLDQIIHANFIECGKSGCIFNKQDTINSLLECKEDRKIEIYNYEFHQIDINTYLIHYITKSKEDLIYRTSVWINEKGLKLLFHQATKLNEAVNINPFVIFGND